MKLLHLDASVLGDNSVSRQLSAAVVARFTGQIDGLQVDYRDLDANPVPHLRSSSLAKTDAAEATDAEQVMQQFLEADIVVIGAPMYNFSVTSSLKAWLDRVIVAGRTFRYGANGPEGLAGGKRVVIASSRGGIYSQGPAAAMDFQETYLRTVLGFIGITDVDFVFAEGIAYGPEVATKAASDAKDAIKQIVAA